MSPTLVPAADGQAPAGQSTGALGEGAVMVPLQPSDPWFSLPWGNHTSAPPSTSQEPSQPALLRALTGMSFLF